MNRYRLPHILCLFLLLCLIPVKGLCDTVRVDGSTFPRSVTLDGTRLFLTGAALQRYLVIVKGYAGAFYLPANTPAAEALGPVPKYLVLEYKVSISAGDFAEATTRSIQDAVDAKTFASIEDRLNALNALYADVKPNDRYSLYYHPDRGTQLALNGTVAGTLPGLDFARALFGVWLGEKPIDPDFRDRLLGVKP
ncbi:chalcone isomerase family protein [Desulfatiferula olefinivorans]